MSRQPIVTLRVGAHLYGTQTPSSDLDIKGIVVPCARDILLQQVPAVLNESRPRAAGERNEPGDVDVETFSLQRFLTLVTAGQPIAIEMLFAPDSAMLAPPDPLWREVQALAPKLVSRRADVFLRYCRAQAERYGATGERAAAVQSAQAVLAAAEADRGAQARLEDLAEPLAALAATSPHIALVDIAIRDGKIMRHLAICDRKVPFSATLHLTREIVDRIAAGYGARGRAAAEQGGVDWKALSHAVRIGREVIELVSTGRLRFPLACAPHLLAIKLGQVPRDQVVRELDALPGEVERAAARSALPEHPDEVASEALVLRVYRARVLEESA
jgi:hypothetical protein